MPPILQRLITPTLGILLRLLLLRQVPFAVRHDLAHMIDILVPIGIRVLGRVMFEDVDNLAAAVASR